MCSSHSRHGQSTKRYLIYDRFPLVSTRPGPGPSTYDMGNFSYVKRRAPSYTFGCRHKLSSAGTSPGPNAYELPSFIGSGGGFYPWFPGFTIAGKRKIKDYVGPTPALRAIEYKCRCAPKFTIKGRLPPLCPSSTPSSYAYKPECVLGNRKLWPSWSFGIKHSPRKIIPITC